VDEPDRNRVEEVVLLAAAPARDHEAGLLEHLEVLHHAEARHRQPLLERAERLPVLLEQLVEQAAARRVGEGLEHGVHAWSIGDRLVTCQVDRRTRCAGPVTARPARAPRQGLGFLASLTALMHARRLLNP
jgi:hypothetical protein